jgi:hypothetical protein
MLSKQGKRSKAQKQSTRRPRSKAEGKRRPKAPQPLSRRFENLNSTAPLAGSKIQRGFFAWKFGAAAPHDEFPEGGLRISGMLPGTSASGTIINDTLTEGVFGTGGQQVVLVNPNGCTTTGGSAIATAALFSSSGPLSVFATYFRRFRFRRLEAEYTSRISAADSSTKMLQFSYERDAATAVYSVWGTTNAVNASTVRFPAWTPSARIPIIEQKKTDVADELWYTTIAGDSFTDAIVFERQVCQGAFIGVTTTVATSDVTWGNMLYHFTIDLYGFNNSAPVNAGAAQRRLELRDEKSVGPRLAPDPSQDKGDRKELHDFVELTPKSRRVDSTPPPSVRVSSRKN